MFAWLLKSLGISDQITGHMDRVAWAWARPAWLLVGLALLVPVAWYICKRHARNMPHVSPRARRTMSLCRIGVLLLLVVVLGGPYLRLQETLEQKPVLAILKDESASMSLPAGPIPVERLRDLAYAAGLITPDSDGQLPPVGDELSQRLQAMTRAELLDALLAAQLKTSTGLREKYDVRTYGVSRRVRRLDDTAKDSDPLTTALASESALGQAIEQAADDAQGRQVAAVLLLSDGRHTLGPAPLNVVQRLNAGGDPDAPALPVITVPLGSGQPIPDVALLELTAPPDVAKGDTVAVPAVIGSQGFDGQTVQVTLRDGGKTLDTQTVTLDGSRRQQLQLKFEASDPGTRILTAAVEPLEPERVRNNNAHSVAVRVDERRIRVLVIEGVPRWDTRFLDHALRRDKAIESRIVMESQLQAAGIKPEGYAAAAKLPTDVASLAEYHLLLLGDVSPALLTPAMQQAIVEAVQTKGLGLIIAAGTQHMPHGYLDSPLRGLLPLAVLPRENEPPLPGQPTGGMDAPPFEPFRVHVSPAGSMHPAFALLSDASENRNAWSRMDPFFWAVRAGELRPGATLLAEVQTTSGRQPLIAEQFVGAGRVLLVGTDETFRWRRNIGDAHFYRFWGQAIRHTARKNEGDGKQSWITATPHRVEPGSPVAVELYAVSDDGEPLTAPSVTARLMGTTPPQNITLERGPQPGHFRAAWTPDSPGLYSFQYTGSDDNPLTAVVQAADSGRELRHTTVDRDALGAIAHAGGKTMVEPHDLHRLHEMLSGRTVTVHRKHEQEIWDNWLVLLLLVGFYCTDVGIRRLLGLN